MKKKLDLDAVLDATVLDADVFTKADEKEQDHRNLKSIVAGSDDKKVAGRPIAGKSKATNKIAFMVDDEVLEYLESLTDRKDRTGNAVAKKLLMSNYEIHKKTK
jgi:hypothetical protein